MAERKLTPAEASSVLLSRVYGVGYFDKEVAEKLQLRGRKVNFNPEVASQWGSILTDAQKSQLLVATVTRVLQYGNGAEPKTFKSSITGRERKVLSRYGISNGELRSQEELAKEFGVDPKHIRYIEAKALRKLRRPEEREYFKEFLPVSSS